jgi:hypothetical protein
VQQGDFEGGLALWVRAETCCRRLGDTVTEVMIVNNKGEVAFNRNDFQAAAAYFSQGLTMKEELNLRTYIGSSLVGLMKTHYQLRSDPASREQCRCYAARLAGLESAKPQQRQHAREIIDALDTEERSRP